MILQTINPSTQKRLPGDFPITTNEEIDATVKAAYEAWKCYKKITGKKKAVFLRTIACGIKIG